MPMVREPLHCSTGTGNVSSRSDKLQHRSVQARGRGGVTREEPVGTGGRAVVRRRADDGASFEIWSGSDVTKNNAPRRMYVSGGVYSRGGVGGGGCWH